MKNYLNKNNFTESLKEVLTRNHIEVASFNDFVNEAYNYAVECKNSKNYTEKACVMLIKKYIDVPFALFIEVWGVISMYCFENLVHSFINKMAALEDDKEEMKCIGMATIVDAARTYKWDNDYRRIYELSIEALTADLAPKASKFITYAGTSIYNNLKRFNRESHPIHVPDKLAYHIAKISEVLDEFEFEISTKEIELILKEQNIKVPSKKVAMLEQVCRIERSLNSPVDHAELEKIPAPNSDPSELVAEEETIELIKVAFPKITAEIYGYENAYIANMKAANLSYYKMEWPVRRFRMISQYLDDAASENNELLDVVNEIKLSVCTYGERGARAHTSSPIASHYLSASINHANALKEEIDRGERTIEECIGSDCPAGTIRYLSNKMFPQKKGDVPKSELATSREYRNSLRKAGLGFLADEIKAHI